MTEPVYSNPSPDHQITKLHLHELFKPSAPCIISSSSSDCESQRTRSTATLPISFGSSIKMNSFDSTETDDEIVNIMQTDTSRAGHGNAAVISPFERWTTPRIANRKILTPEDANTSAVGMIDFESASVVPSSIAPPSTASVFQDFSFACEDLSMTQFEKADSEFFAPFNSGNKNKVVQSSEGSNIPLREQVTVKQEALNEEVMKEEVVKQEPVLSKAPSEENSLNPDDCRPLNVKDINDIVNASKHQTGTVHRYHRDNDNPSLHDSSYMDECSTAAKSLNSSPQSVMDFDNSTFASSKMSKPRRKKKNQGRNLNTSSFSEAGESRTTRDTFDDDTSSFVSSKVSYSLRDDTRIRVGRISDDSSSKQSSVVENIVYSAPLARLHEFITGNGLCCTSKGQDSLIIGEACSEYERKSPKKSSYDDNEYYDDNTTFYDEDDVTYDDTTYTGMDDETASYRHRRGGSAYSIESSAYYTTDDDETVSRASTRSSYHHHVTKSSSHKSTPEPLKLKASPLGSRGSSRGRSPTIRNGYNSDRSLSRCASTASSGNSNEKLVQGTKLKECDSRDISLKSNESSQASAEASAAAESVLLQDQNSWMEMTSPSPYRSVNISTDSAQTSSSKKSLNASMGSTKSNFLQNLQAKTASAKITPTKAQCASTTIESFNAHKTSPETDGTFKKLLSVGIQLQINDVPAAADAHCQKRQGKLLLCFNGDTEGKFEAPYFIWKDMNNNAISFTVSNATNKIDSISLSDIKTIRKPREAELHGYPLATPEHCFILALLNGVTFLLEALNVVQMNRVIAGLNGILNKLEQDINTTGDFTWINQSLESVKRKASDVQPHVVKKTTGVKKSLMQEAAMRRKMKRRQQN